MSRRARPVRGAGAPARRPHRAMSRDAAFWSRHAVDARARHLAPGLVPGALRHAVRCRRCGAAGAASDRPAPLRGTAKRRWAALEPEISGARDPVGWLHPIGFRSGRRPSGHAGRRPSGARGGRIPSRRAQGLAWPAAPRRRPVFAPQPRRRGLPATRRRSRLRGWCRPILRSLAVWDPGATTRSLREVPRMGRRDGRSARRPLRHKPKRRRGARIVFYLHCLIEISETRGADRCFRDRSNVATLS